MLSLAGSTLSQVLEVVRFVNYQKRLLVDQKKEKTHGKLRGDHQTPACYDDAPISVWGKYDDAPVPVTGMMLLPYSLRGKYDVAPISVRGKYE
ncbi:hypothetical protein E3N88_15067 [Mikania micrantha]|uniref:Uncharacterized protein n=1 Tax=Mikania micrantha TaxID=192012 RepID=A0A5N6P4K3_9ASTR|nr:hypothetical protein E3N88_15067 [Mikania micrantha]